MFIFQGAGTSLSQYQPLSKAICSIMVCRLWSQPQIVHFRAKGTAVEPALRKKCACRWLRRPCKFCPLADNRCPAHAIRLSIFFPGISWVCWSILRWFFSNWIRFPSFRILFRLESTSEFWYDNSTAISFQMALETSWNHQSNVVDGAKCNKPSCQVTDTYRLDECHDPWQR